MTRAELIARIKALAGPDKSLDEEIWEMFGGWPTPEYRSVDYRKVFATPITGSLDSAVAFVERIRPGVWWMIAKGRLAANEPLYGAHLLFGPEEVIGEGEGPTAAIALVLAAVQAVNSGEIGHG